MKRATLSFVILAATLPATAQLPPVTTTTLASGSEDEHAIPGGGGSTLVITLEGNDPQDPVADLIATIRQLPVRGSLRQFDGTPIDSVPTDVTDPDGRVQFLVPSHHNGAPYDTFHYTVTNPTDNRRSAWGRVDVDVAPGLDRPIGIRQVPPSSQIGLLEDRSVFLRFGGFDPDVEFGPDFDEPLHGLFGILPPPSAGTMFQVQEDNRTPGDPITESGMTFTNPHGWVLFQAAQDFRGDFLISYLTVDRPLGGGGFFSDPAFTTIEVVNVNDPVHAQSTIHRGVSNRLATSVVLDAVDPEGGFLTGAVTRLPRRGDLYRNSTVTEANRITAANPTISGRSLAYASHDPNAFGDPFDTFSYVITDGATAAPEVTDTIVIDSVGGLPQPDPVDEYVVRPDDPAGLPFALHPVAPAGHPFGDLFVFVHEVPQHGTLVLQPPVVGTPIVVSSSGFLPQTPSEEAGWTLLYVPDPGFDSVDPTTGTLTPDSFTYFLLTSLVVNPEEFTVRLFACDDADDADGDGMADCCPDDPNKTTPGDCGCGVAETGDRDADSAADCVDACPDDPNKTEPGVCGCGIDDQFAPDCIPIGDSDGDGVADADDGCPFDPNKIEPGSCGCGTLDADIDGDGVPFCLDGCPGDPNKQEPGLVGCGFADTDDDGDGVPNAFDACPGDPNKSENAGNCGCGVADVDTDGDTEVDCFDGCPNDPDKTDPGILGCGVADIDTDGDFLFDPFDGCPADPNKTAPGDCGCGNPETPDSDGDEVLDCNDTPDLCPDDPAKDDPGVCGCGVADIDTDLDGTPDCNDGCASDAAKVDAGLCGCGVSDVDTDVDGTPDCNDLCPNDADKTELAICGCGVADTDTDGDGVADCVDVCPGGDDAVDFDLDGTPDACDDCPTDPDKIVEGVCGCGVADSDADGNGIIDCVDACAQGSDSTDSDADGTPDACDNCIEQFNPDQTDTDGDGFGDACDADIDNDCQVNVRDLIECVRAFGRPHATCDRNGDGVVGVPDLRILIPLLRQSPGPSCCANCPR